MLERNRKLYERLIRDVRPVLARRLGRERAEEVIRGAEPIHDRFLAETPYIGGRENILSKNLDMYLPFFAIYEASGRTLTEETVDEMLDAVRISRCQKIEKLINMNRLDRPWFRKLAYRLARKAAGKINAHRGKDWNNTWGVQINPESHSHGLAMTLVGCPLVDFAREHGYMEIMPCLCRSDVRVAEALHARLIRHHTVAQGYETCDYWFVGDRDTESR